MSDAIAISREEPLPPEPPMMLLSISETLPRGWAFGACVIDT